MTRTTEQMVEFMVDYATRAYTTSGERAALRCGLSDAAHLCDRLAEIIEEEHRGYHGKGPATKRGQELAAVAKRCGDAIWAVRLKITMPEPSP